MGTNTHIYIYICVRKAFSPHCVRGEPPIHQVRSRSDEEVSNWKGGLETISDVLIRGWWESQTEEIIDVRLGEPDFESHKREPTGMLLAWWDKEKEEKPSNNFHKQRKTFSPFLSLLMECLEMCPYSYSLIWVDSWQKKWSNSFWTFKAGSTVG